MKLLTFRWNMFLSHCCYNNINDTWPLKAFPSPFSASPSSFTHLRFPWRLLLAIKCISCITLSLLPIDFNALPSPFNASWWPCSTSSWHLPPPHRHLTPLYRLLMHLHRPLTLFLRLSTHFHRPLTSLRRHLTLLCHPFVTPCRF